MGESAGHIDPHALERSLQGLRDTVQAADLETALSEVLYAACDMFGISGTGLMVIDGDQSLRYVAATDETGKLLEETQARIGHGPCVDSLVFDRVIQSRSLADDERWEELKPLVRDRGVCAVLGVPVHIAGESVGSLDGYCDVPHEWSQSEVRALQAYADLLGNLLASAVWAEQRGELAEQLQHALDSRVEIERAIGMIMGLESLDAVEAFNRLRRAARNRGERVVALARRVLGGERLADLEGAERAALPAEGRAWMS